MSEADHSWSWNARWWVCVLLVLSGSGHVSSAEKPSLPETSDVRRIVVEPKGTKIGFEKLPSERTGIRFTNRLAQTRAILNRTLLNGSGVAAGDVDGDGRCDLYFCGLDTDNALYRNLGNWRFQDITSTAGVACSRQDSTGAVFADVDGDGDLDLLVTGSGHGVRLFQNDGQGKFIETTGSAGLASKAASMSMALADIDGDGDLDLYVANYRTSTIADQPAITFGVEVIQGKPTVVRVNGQPATSPEWTNRFVVSPSGEVLEWGEPDVLYLNDGKGKFSPVSWTGGAFLDEDGQPISAPPRDWGLTVQMRDFTGDGAPDIYVCNDFFTPDRIWVNNGQGHFQAIARTAIRTTSVFSMGVDFADIDRDGHVDIFVADMLSPDPQKRHVQLGGRSNPRTPVGLVENRPQISRNTLQYNRGDGTFAEIAYYAGVEASDWTWSPLFLDVDLDGYEDILISNGVLRDFQNMDRTEDVERARAGKRLSQAEILQFMSRFPTLETPNIVFRNNRDGTFEDKAAEWGFATRNVSQGMALADLDNDGDLDVAVNCLMDGAGIYENASPAPRVAIRLRGQAPNTQGTGARLRVLGGPAPQSQEIINGGSYLSGSDAVRVFAAGATTNRLEVEVDWRSGRRSSLWASPNTICEITEPQTPPETRRAEPVKATCFEEIPNAVFGEHHENAFDDFIRQPLLLRSLSQLGPGVAWHDLDGDGREDLIIGSGKGGRLTACLNKGTGFVAATNAIFNRVIQRDQTTVLGSGTTLLVGSANYEDGSTNGGLVRIYDLQRNASGESLLGYPFSGGPMALADIDGDGDLDLFVGGRVVPGRYPEPADSILFVNDGGRLVQAQRWSKLGLVSGAVFSDLDQDGIPELLLATEWGPIRVFQRRAGEFQERTREWGLAEETGWWAGVATGDFDGDGRPEIVASNWGLNTAYRATPERPRKVYFGDLDGNGTLDLIEARMDPSVGKELPERTLLVARAALPFLQERVASFEAYGRSSVQEIYGPALNPAQHLEVKTLQSAKFTMLEGKFHRVPLPRQAQLAPAYGVCVGDLDGDGAEDLFLSQNCFALAPGESRADAGRGLWLRGNGRGDFSAVPSQESGIAVYGEGRGCALCDYDQDGRMDLAVAQNGNRTKVFHNRNARPGLRVRLSAGAWNPTAIGATVRLAYGDRMGPAHEIQAGSGYWSQNSTVVVLGATESATGIWVRWPGGATTVSPLPAAAADVRIIAGGSLQVMR